MTITKNDTQLIELIEMALNSEDREGQLGDNYSNLGLSDAMEVLGMDWKDAKNWLEGNGFYLCDPSDVSGRGYKKYSEGAIAWLEEDTINAYFDMKEAEGDDTQNIVFNNEVYRTDASADIINLAINTVKIHAKDSGFPLTKAVNMIKVLGYTMEKVEAPAFTI